MQQPMILMPGEGRTFQIGASYARVLVESAAGDFSVIEHDVAAGLRTPAHVHNSFDEAFYVLLGEVEFIVDGRSARVGAGGLALAPRGTAHAFGNSGSVDARMLVIGSPGVARLVEEVGPLVREVPPDLGRITAAFARHDSRLAP